MPSLSTVEKSLKIISSDKKLQTQWFEDQPLLKWLMKKENFYGRELRLPIGYGPGGGRSHTFGVSQEQSNRGRKYDEFVITRTRDYGTLYIDNEAIEASEKGDAAFLETHSAELKGLNIRLGQDLGYKVWGDGWGIAGKIATGGIAGNVITLSNPDQIVRFEVDDELEVYVPGTHPLTKRTGPVGYLTVTNIDEINGKLTVSNIADVTSVTALDELVKRGDYGLAPKGVRAYMPFTEAEFTANPTLWGMNRTPNPARMAGRRYDASGKSLVGGIELALSYGSRAGVKYNSLWINDKYFVAFSQEAGNRLVRDQGKDAVFGYDTFFFVTKKGRVPVYVDQNLDDFAVALNREAWEFKFLKKPMRYLTDGSSIVKPTADGIEVRYGWRGQMLCFMPGDNMAIQLPSIVL